MECLCLWYDLGIAVFTIYRHVITSSRDLTTTNNLSGLLQVDGDEEVVEFTQTRHTLSQ